MGTQSCHAGGKGSSWQEKNSKSTMKMTRFGTFLLIAALSSFITAAPQRGLPWITRQSATQQRRLIPTQRRRGSRQKEPPPFRRKSFSKMFLTVTSTVDFLLEV